MKDLQLLAFNVKTCILEQVGYYMITISKRGAREIKAFLLGNDKTIINIRKNVNREGFVIVFICVYVYVFYSFFSNVFRIGAI